MSVATAQVLLFTACVYIEIVVKFVSEVMGFFQSEKCGRKLVRDGYMYHKNTTQGNGSTYWECCERRSGSGCKAKITLDPNDIFVGQSAPHTHPPNQEKVEAQKSRSRMRIDARISNARTNNVVAANLAVANDAVLAQLPSLETMRRDVRRNRQVHQELPEVPDRGNHLFEIPHPFDETTTGERFLHYDNNREARILTFGTRRSFDHLANSDHWFMDGTFSTVPFQFSQLLSHGLNQGRNAVGAYCLLPDKRANTYVEMLTEIHVLANDVIPESVMIDFEQGMIAAWEQVFPLATIKGCLFHLSKSIYRKFNQRD